MEGYVREFWFLFSGVIHVESSGTFDNVPRPAVNVIRQVDVWLIHVPIGNDFGMSQLREIKCFNNDQINKARWIVKFIIANFDNFHKHGTDRRTDGRTHPRIEMLSC